MESLPGLATWLEETIAHIYDRPEMYARTLSELDLTLYTHQFIWGMIDGRAWAIADSDLFSGSYEQVLKGDAERHRMVDFADRGRFKVVIEHWREVDARIGLNPHSDEF